MRDRDSPRSRDFSPGLPPPPPGSAWRSRSRVEPRSVSGDGRRSAAAPFRERRHRAVVLADRRRDAAVDDVGVGIDGEHLGHGHVRGRERSGRQQRGRTLAQRSSPSCTPPASTPSATSRRGHSRPSPTVALRRRRTTPTGRTRRPPRCRDGPASTGMTSADLRGLRRREYSAARLTGAAANIAAGLRQANRRIAQARARTRSSPMTSTATPTRARPAPRAAAGA